MTISVEVSTIIDRKVEDVFRILATEHVENHPKWDPDIQLEKVTEGAFGKGTLLKRVNSRNGTPVDKTILSKQMEGAISNHKRFVEDRT